MASGKRLLPPKNSDKAPNGRFSPRALQEKLFTASKQGNLNKLENLLSENYVNIDHIGYGGKSALYHAVTQQHVPAVKTLLDYGVDVQLASFATYHRDHVGVHLMSSDEPPIVSAARVDNADIVQLLLEAGANPDEQALCHTNLSGVSIKDRTALHFACENVNVAMVKTLLRFSADVNIEDKQRELAIHIAVRCRKCSCQREILQSLCEHGSDVNTVNKIECPPLYLASFYGCVQKVETLLFYGANVNNLCVRESSYGTCLHIAALKDRFELTEKLILHGAQLNLKNGWQYTPLHLNINSHSKSTVGPLLIYHGADTSGFDKFNYTLLASIIRNMRFDCELLASLIIYAGYDLRHDIWLLPPNQTEETNNRVHDNASLNREHNSNSESSTEDDTSVILPIEVPHVPIPQGRISNLCHWLYEIQTNPLKLSHLCRIKIRNNMSQLLGGRSIVQNIRHLPLPNTIKDYLALRDLINVEELKQT